MKLIYFHRKSISIFVMFIFTILLCFWANKAPAAETAPVAEKNSRATLEQGDSSSPDFFEQEREDEAVIKKAKKFPWLLVGLGAVAVGVALYFLVIKKHKNTLTITLGAGTTGTPAATTNYKKDETVAYCYIAQDGYHNLEVKLDNVVISNSGTVTMNTNHALSIGATKNIATYNNGVLMVNGVRYELAKIPAGEFHMGSNSSEAYSNEQPVHTVRISKGFWLCKTEVTQGLWQAVMGRNPSFFKKGDIYPVEQVSWYDCQTFITKLNQLVGGNLFRLPTEAEWEYSCRAGTTGERYGNIDAIAWYNLNSGGTTHQVGQKQANAWGLYDTLGNVYEWCQDFYGAYSAGYQTDPTGPSSGGYFVYRGGRWGYNNFPDEARLVRAALRRWDLPGFFNSGIGFRLARTEG